MLHLQIEKQRAVKPPPGGGGATQKERANHNAQVKRVARHRSFAPLHPRRAPPPLRGVRPKHFPHREGGPPAGTWFDKILFSLYREFSFFSSGESGPSEALGIEKPKGSFSFSPLLYHTRVVCLLGCTHGSRALNDSISSSTLFSENEPDCNHPS